MDAFTFMIALVIMMLAVQFQQNWLVIAIVAVLILTTRSLNVTLLLITAALVLYFTSDIMKEYWPFVLFGLVILSILFGVGKKEQEQSQFDMGMEMPPMGPGGMY